jgi:hypothetical protein
LSIVTAKLIKSVITLYLIYKFSNYNICLIGDSSTRFNLVKALNYILNLNLVKILISTMIDINDLLGTFEQISDNDSIDAEKSLSEFICSQDLGGDYQSEKTKFVFIESRVIRSLRDEHNLVYVEVPNDVIAERIEKGLKDVYQQKRQIVLGIDTLNANKTTISKFITVDLTGLTVGDGDWNKTYSTFASNESNLTHNDLALRREQTKDFILQAIND